MKINMPVTDREVKLRDGQELVTKTDLKGTITYVNPAFLEISGFTLDELMGKNHNVVRHPDMPAAAFKDLWDTLKLGRPWCKFVKNRCKNGDYYWVKANVTPVMQNGQIVEYMSVRTRPTETEIAEAAALYAKLNQDEVALPSPEALQTENLAGQVNKWAGISVAIAAVGAGVGYAVGGAAATAVGPAAGLIAMIIGAASTVGKSTTDPLKKSVSYLKQIAEGHYHTPIPVEEPGEFGSLNRAVKSLAIKLGFEVNDAKEEANRALRIKQALDNVGSNVMLADNDGNLIYLNEAVINMMRKAQDDIRKDLPEFDVDKLLGANFDSFHKNPDHQRKLLASLKDTYNGRIMIGGRTFDLVANPVSNDHGERLGTVVEWQDVTDQLAAQQQIEHLIQQATSGQLDQRLDTAVYHGFMLNIANGVNEMLDAVVEPIKEVKRVLNSLAQGDLTDSMEGDFHGEFAVLNTNLNESMQKLQQVVGEIRTAGTSITSGSSEIAKGNATLSQRTESQAASLQETAASMEEMTSTVRQNAENASQASELAEEAKQLAVDGGTISEKVVQSMGEISQSSSKIAEIIGVIDEIAFQTNLLALNAAVEAARAGEQGRGFAVVASEVRNLAQRSASAAKEIKELINDSVEKVEEGARYVDESGKALTEIMESVQKVSSIVGEIAGASKEQAGGIEQVNVAITQMDEGTQQNAALVEQVAAASESMEEQAQQLQRQVNVFKVDPSVARSSGEPAAPSISRVKQLAGQGGTKSSKDNVPVLTANDSAEEWEEF